MRPRGFAAIEAEKRREIARKGGIAAHAKGTGHRFTSETAREAGMKGGQTLAARKGYMAELGAKGGMATRGLKRRG